MTDARPGKSLVRRVLPPTLVAIAFVWLAAAAVAFLQARHEAGELLDGYLVQTATILHASAGEDVDDDEVEHAPRLHRYARQVVFQVWEHGTTLRLHSAHAPDVPLSKVDTGFSTETIDGVVWRVFSSWDQEHHIQVKVAEAMVARNAIAESVGSALALPLVVALPVVAILLWWTVTRGIKPLMALRDDVARRDPDSLESLDATDVPAEVVPLVTDLNRLFRRVRESIDRERHFTADAAHELRTPLAALRAHAELARDAGGDDARRRALDQVLVGCDRMARLVGQLLTLARLEPLAGAMPGQTVDLTTIARDVLSDLAEEAIAQGVEPSLDTSDPVLLRGDAALLAILIRNLVDNAIRHAGSGSGVTVTTLAFPHGGGSRLAVSDTGKGVPDAERHRLGERFFRAEATGNVTGSGLGLSIVSRIAELHAGTVEVSSGTGGRGLRVAVTFAGSSRAGAAADAV